MELIPIMKLATSIFLTVVIFYLTVSYIIYKMRKKDPGNQRLKKLDEQSQRIKNYITRQTSVRLKQQPGSPAPAQPAQQRQAYAQHPAQARQPAYVQQAATPNQHAMASYQKYIQQQQRTAAIHYQKPRERFKVVNEQEKFRGKSDLYKTMKPVMDEQPRRRPDRPVNVEQLIRKEQQPGVLGSYSGKNEVLHKPKV